MARATRSNPPASLIALALYLALAVIVFWTVWDAPTRDWIGHSLDPPLFIWHFRWLPFALGGGHNPLLSNYLNYPDGFNLMWNTSAIFPAFVLSPVTLLLGPIFSYNLFGTLAPALSAWTAYFLFRRYVRRPAAAWIGGLLYGFSPFVFTQAGGHPHMTFAVYPPLAMLLLDEILIRQRRSPYVLGLVLGLATFVQLLTGEELVAISILVGFVGVVLLGILHRGEIRRHLSYAAQAVGTAAAVALSLSAYPLYTQLFETKRAAGSTSQQGVFVFDLLQFVVPSPRQLLTFASANNLFGRFSGTSELGGYVGLPLLLLIGWLIVRYRSDRLVRFSAILLAVVVVLGFGPRLHVAGRAAALPLPWVIPQRLPILEHLLPARLAVVMFLLLGLLLAVFVDRFTVRSTANRAALAGIVALALVPLLPKLPYSSERDDTPRFFTSGAEQIPKGSVAVVAPIAAGRSGTSVSMVWQARATMRFRMTWGYVIRRKPKSGGRPNRVLFERMLQIQAGEATAPLTKAERLQILCEFKRFHVRTIVVGPMNVGESESIALFRQLLARPPVETGGVKLWPVDLVGSRGPGDACA